MSYFTELSRRFIFWRWAIATPLITLLLLPYILVVTLRLIAGLAQHSCDFLSTALSVWSRRKG